MMCKTKEMVGCAEGHTRYTIFTAETHINGEIESTLSVLRAE